MFFLFLFLFMLSNNGFDRSEGLYHYALAERMVKSGKLHFEAHHRREYGACLFPFLHIVGPDKKIYNHHEIGNTLFMLPMALLNVSIEKSLGHKIDSWTLLRSKLFLESFLPNLYLALGCAFYYAILRRTFRCSHRKSLAGTCLLVFSTYYWTYSRNLFDGVLCLPLLLFSFLMLAEFKRVGRMRYIFYAFLCLGLGVITRATMIFAILSSMIYLFLTAEGPRRLKSGIAMALTASATLIPFALWQGWYNHVRTGHFYVFPLMIFGPPGERLFEGHMGSGILGLLVSPGKSIFIFSPLLIFSVYFFPRFYRRFKPEAWYIMTLAFFWLMVHAQVRLPEGNWGWGPRYFITVLPFLFLPAAVCLDHLERGLASVLAALLGGWGFILALSSIVSDWYFREAHAEEQARGGWDIFIWSLNNNQAVDMVRAAFSNFMRILEGGPIISVKAYFVPASFGANTINLWPVNVIHAGVPWPYVTVVTLALLVLTVVFLKRLIGYREG